MYNYSHISACVFYTSCVVKNIRVIFFVVAEQPSLPCFEVFRPHTIRHTHTHHTQTPYTHTTHTPHTHTTHTHHTHTTHTHHTHHTHTHTHTQDCSYIRPQTAQFHNEHISTGPISVT